jgi:hypothetical protein
MTEDREQAPDYQLYKRFVARATEAFGAEPSAREWLTAQFGDAGETPIELVITGRVDPEDFEAFFRTVERQEQANSAHT